MGMTGTVFDIQRYSIHDGPGIRTLVFMKGCPLHCKWCSNPEGLSMRPNIMFTPRLCYGCGRCAAVCQSGAITGQNGEVQWHREKCTNCLRCASACKISHARKICGTVYTVSGLMDEVRKDKTYYDRKSGGGLTVGGGEPMLQADFVRELMQAAHAEGINTALESSSYASGENARKIYEVTDHIFTDIKHMDPNIHKRLTGVSNEPILENIKMAAQMIDTSCQHLVIRIPIIPDMNDSEENIRKTAEFVKALKVVDRIEILPYHNLGEEKYYRIPGTDSYALHGVLMLEKGDLSEPYRWISEAGIKCNIGGL